MRHLVACMPFVDHTTQCSERAETPKSLVFKTATSKAVTALISYGNFREKVGGGGQIRTADAADMSRVL